MPEDQSRTRPRKARCEVKAATVIAKYNPCSEALAWLGKRTPKQAWEQCPRGDWLLWFAARIGVDRKLIVRAACDCARTALKHVPKGEDGPRTAIETTERWCDCKATIAEVRTAAYAAAPAAYAAADAAAYAAYANAVHAAYAAYAAADAAAPAAYAAAYAVGTKAHKRCAALVRKRIPWSVVRERLGAK